MRSFGNLKGTIYKDRMPMIKFEYSRNELVSCEIINVPDLYEFKMLPAEKALPLFLDDRVTPETRIGLQDYLDEWGLGTFNFEKIIKATKGKSIHDSYWVDAQ